MLQYVIKRLLLMIPTILGAAFVIFFILRVVPGDVCELKLAGDGGHYDPVQDENSQKNHGIDRPLYEQYGKFVNGIRDASLKKGYICLESEGKEIHFRNIRIMELPAGMADESDTAPLIE